VRNTKTSAATVENPAGDQLWVDGGSPPGDVVTVTGIDRRARQHPRFVRHRQTHRGRQGPVSIFGGTVGRYQDVLRALPGITAAIDRKAAMTGELVMQAI
jgi:hypothetical protein